MKKKEKVSILLMLVLVLTIALCGCAGDKEGNSSGDESNTSAVPVEGGEITAGIPQDLDSLDPHIARAAGTREILFNVFEGLIKPDENGNLIEAVAERYEILEDGKVYIFTLREDVKFHNGEAVTIEDVKYSIERCADAENAEAFVSAYASIESIEVIDEKNIEIRLQEPNTEFLAYMTTAIIPKEYDNQAVNPVGTGPFCFVSRELQNTIVIEKFSEYWGEAAHLDKVTFKVIADADMIVTNLKSGGIDFFARVTAAQAAELTQGFQIYEGTMNLVQALYLNHEAEPLDNENVRKALSYALDPQEIMDMTADGKGTQIGTSMFPAFGKYYDESLNAMYEQDIEKAKELLKEEGYEDGFELEITIPSNYQQYIDIAQVMVEQLKPIGVTAKIQLIEWDSWLSDVYGNREYQTTIVGVDASVLTAGALLARFVTDASGNFINYKNAEYDRLFEEASKTIDDEEKVRLYKEAGALLAETAANVYIQDLANLVALNEKYDGYVFYPAYIQDMSKIYRIE